MRTHSNSYAILRRDIQESIDFIVLSCHATPALLALMRLVESDQNKYEMLNKIPDPDHFGQPTRHSRLKEIAPKRKKVLLKHWQIPKLFEEAFGLDIPPEEVTQFHFYRKKRNDIAHGQISEIDLKEAI